MILLTLYNSEMKGNSSSNGRRKYALNLAKAVTATSIDAIFIEAHKKPDLPNVMGLQQYH